MATGTIFSYSDLFNIYGIIENSSLTVIKQLIIAQLRGAYSRDSYYSYHEDKWGYPEVVDHTNLSLGAGINDNLTTRVYIGEYNPMVSAYYPSMVVKSGQLRYQAMSINRELDTIRYTKTLVTDNNGNSKEISVPSAFLFAGFFESDILIDITARDIRSVEDLVGFNMILFSDIAFRDLEKSGVIIKGVSAGSMSTSPDRNDLFFKTTITLNILSQWRRELPINSFVDIINICIDFTNNINSNPITVSPNLEINEQINLIDQINNL